MDRATNYFENCPKKIIDFLGRTWESDKEYMSGCIRWIQETCPDEVEVMCTPFWESEEGKESAPLQVMIEGELIFAEEIRICDIDKLTAVDQALANALSLVHFDESPEDAGEEDEDHTDAYAERLAMAINCGWRNVKDDSWHYQSSFLKGLERALSIYLECKE